MARLAYEETAITIDRDTIYLRPTLRAASCLHAEFGGFERIVLGIAEGNVSVMSAIVRECAREHTYFPAYLAAFEGRPLQRLIDILSEPLMTLAFALCGYDPDAPVDDKEPKAPRVTFEDHHRKLYGIATGWLGWTPETAWNATPNEIIEAYRGRTDLLKAIFGGADDKSDHADLSLDDKIARAMSRFPRRVVSPSAA